MGFTKVNEQDTRRPDGRNCLLVYGYTPADLDVIRALLPQAGIDELLPVAAGGTGLLLRDLLADAVQDQPADPLPPVPVAVFHAVSDQELNGFLQGFRSSGLPRPLFAVVTPVSINWRFADLASELMRERRAMAKNDG